MAYPFPAAVDESAKPTESCTAADPENEVKKTKGPISPLPGTGGVYLLTDAEDRIIQLASAGNLRRALQIRLASRTDGEVPEAGVPSRRRADLSQIVRTIRWRTAYSAFEISYEYWRLARMLQPETYLKQLVFGPAWFVHVDSAAAIPRFVVGKVLRSPPGVDLGPFFTNSDATRFVQVLEDGFDLCRYYHILEQAPHGTPCAYNDMGRCPAPCDGSIPMTRYRDTIAESLSFATGEREPIYRQCENAMREAADQQAYEKAGQCKQRLERLREIEHKTFAEAGPVERFNWLIVQRGGGRTRVKPFFVRAGVITPGEIVALKQINTAVEQWLCEMGMGSANKPAPNPSSAFPSASMDRQVLSEQIWLISHFLGKKDPPGLFLRADRLPSPADLAEMIRERFRKPEPPPEADSSETQAGNEPLSSELRNPES